MKYIVYVAENTKCQVNGVNRVYIGVHKTESIVFPGRYIGDGVTADNASSFMYPKSPFQCAVKQYGVEAFRTTPLFVSDNAKEAYSFYDNLLTDEFLKQPFVYNFKIEYQHKPLYQYDITGKLVKTWEDPMEASEFYGYSINKFLWAAHSRDEFLDSYWSEYSMIRIREYSKKKFQHTIYLYSLEGKLELEIVNANEAGKMLGGNYDTIADAILNSKILDGYYVSNKLTDWFLAKPRKTYLHQTFYVYTKEGEFLGSFVGKKVMPIIGCHSWLKISNAFSNNEGWYKDFFMSLTPVEKVPEKPVKEYNYAIDVYTKYGEFIETFKTAEEVRDKYGIPKSKLLRIKQGNKFFGDYIFKYHSK